MENDNIGNVAIAREQFDTIWKVFRGGEEVAVSGVDLTDDEVRALRCNELLQEFDLTLLREEQRRIDHEIKRREARLWRMDAFKGANELVAKLSRKIAAVVDGKMSPAEVTDKEARTLEILYVRTMPFVALSPAEEGKLRAVIRKVAAADHEAGKFQTMTDALRHYGLTAEVEDAN